MMAALQGDHGLVRLIWMSVGDIMWLSCSFPNTSAHAFTLSCGMLNTCPVVGVNAGKVTQSRRKLFGGTDQRTAAAHRAHERW